MPKRSDPSDQRAELRRRILGLGDRSMAKSYFPELQERLDDLERFRTLLDYIPDAVFLVEISTGRLVDVNQSALHLTGLPRETLLEREFIDLFPDLLQPDLGADSAHRLSTLLRQRVLEVEVIRDTGEVTALEMTVNRHRLGATLFAVIVARDITGRKIAEASRELSLSLLRATIDANPDGILVVDRAHRVQTYNQRFLQIWGIPDPLALSQEDDVLLRFVFDQLTEPQAFLEGVQRLYSDPDAEGFDVLTFRDGRTIERRTFPQWLEGSIVGRVWQFRDVTERVRADEALRESELELRQAQAMASMGSWRFDLNTKTARGSEETCRIYGIPPDGLSISTVQQIPLPEYRPMLDAALTDLILGLSPYNVEFRIQRPTDGSIVDIRSMARYDPTKNVVFGTLQDITAQKAAEADRSRLEEQLRQAMKMEAIGRLAGGVAHDFNNILTGILGYADLLLHALPPEDPNREEIAEIAAASERAAALTQQLLAFSRKQIIAPKILDLNEVLSDSQRMLARIIGEDIQLLYQPGELHGRVKADPGQIEQILVNLAVNARDAMADGGTLTIATADTFVDAETARSMVDVNPGPYVQIAVSDTGHGMSADVQAHVFEPFFTTKEVGKGTGLGLSTVYGIVQQAGGFIRIASEPHRGTTFFIHLPRVEGLSDPRGAESPTIVPQGNETVLVVEDEETVRRLVTKILNDLGYRVLVAQNADDALTLAQGETGPIDLLLTDVVMPGMNGRELYSALALERPGLRALFMSGYSEDVIAHHGVLDDTTHFLPKPFSIEQLAASIRGALSRPTATSVSTLESV